MHEHRGRFLQPLHLACGIEPALGGDFLAPLGHEAAIRRTHRARDLEHLVRHRHLEVHAGLEQIAQRAHVLHLDVPPVLAQMQRDAVRAGELRGERGMHRIRIARAPRLPQRRDVIDVDAQRNEPAHHGLDSRRAIERATVRVLSSRPSRTCASAACSSRRASSSSRAPASSSLRQADHRASRHRTGRIGGGAQHAVRQAKMIVRLGVDAARPSAHRCRAPGRSRAARAAASRRCAGCGSIAAPLLQRLERAVIEIEHGRQRIVPGRELQQQLVADRSPAMRHRRRQRRDLAARLRRR